MSENTHATYFGQTAAPEASAAENENRGSQTLSTGSSGGSIDPVGSGSQVRHNSVPPVSAEPEEDPFRASLVSRMDMLVRDFREEKISRMETLYQILQTLHEANVSEPIRKATLEQYTLYVDIIASKNKGAVQRGLQSGGPNHQEEPGVGIANVPALNDIIQGGESNTAMDAERFLRELRRDLVHKRRRRSVSSSASSRSASEAADGEGESNKKKRIYQSQLPWYTAEVEAQAKEVDGNRKRTRDILATVQKDLAFAEREIRRATSAPQAFPESEWKHIFKGEAINLDVVFSNLHHIAPPKENVGRVGSTEISLGRSDPVRKVQTSGDWTVAWHAASKATSYVFPHRAEELRQWGDYMASEFSAKHVSAHYKLIAFDRAVRSTVGGGQSIILTDREHFTYLYSAYLLPDGIQGGSNSRIATGEQRPKGRSSEVCRRFNSAGGCRSAANTCRYRHICSRCRQQGHNQDSCTQQI
jgi:hypothetical protein